MRQEISLCELQPKGHCLTTMRQPSSNFRLPDSYNAESIFGETQTTAFIECNPYFFVATMKLF